MKVVRKIKGGLDYDKERADSVGIVPGTEAVSYTHLTLPTIYSV